MKKNYTIRILVIDDDPQQIQLYKLYLNEDRYTLVTARSGRQAVQILNESEFDIILIDMQMPGMDGPELLSKIKKEFKLSTMVIMATAHGASDETMKTLEQGAYDILQKPFSSNRLKLTIRNAYHFKQLWDNYTRLRKVYEQA